MLVRMHGTGVSSVNQPEIPCRRRNMLKVAGGGGGIAIIAGFAREKNDHPNISVKPRPFLHQRDAIWTDRQRFLGCRTNSKSIRGLSFKILCLS